MDLATLESRITAIKKSVEQSLANHNALLGRLAEVEYLYNEAVKLAPAVQEIVGDVVTTVQAVDAVASAV